MDINNIVIHKVEKEQHGEAELTLRNSTLTATAQVRQLVIDAYKLYHKRSGKGLGIFEEDAITHPLQAILRAFLDDETDENFLQFSIQAMNILQDKINAQNFAIGGYVLFVKYSDDLYNNVMIALIRDKNSSSIDEHLNVVETIHLDVDKLHICCQIDIDRWADTTGEEPYITFAKGRGDATTPEYFLKFIGCAEYSDSKRQTDALVDAIKQYCRNQNMSAQDAIVVQQRAADYCTEKAKLGQKIYLADLSHHLDEENPESFLEFINEDGNRFNVGNGFEPNKKSLSRLKRIVGRSSKIDIRFDADLYGDAICLTQHEGNVFLPANALFFKEPPQSLIAMIRENFPEEG